MTAPNIISENALYEVNRIQCAVLNGGRGRRTDIVGLLALDNSQVKQRIVARNEWLEDRS